MKGTGFGFITKSNGFREINIGTLIILKTLGVSRYLFIKAIDTGLGTFLSLKKILHFFLYPTYKRLQCPALMIGAQYHFF
jgi:hypothetical protein